MLLSQFLANCSASMDSTPSRLDFESEEGLDSIYLSVQGKRSGSKILLFMSIFLGELA